MEIPSSDRAEPEVDLVDEESSEEWHDAADGDPCDPRSSTPPWRSGRGGSPARFARDAVPPPLTRRVDLGRGRGSSKDDGPGGDDIELVSDTHGLPRESTTSNSSVEVVDVIESSPASSSPSPISERVPPRPPSSPSPSASVSSVPVLAPATLPAVARGPTVVPAAPAAPSPAQGAPTGAAPYDDIPPVMLERARRFAHAVGSSTADRKALFAREIQLFRQQRSSTHPWQALPPRAGSVLPWRRVDAPSRGCTEAGEPSDPSRLAGAQAGVGRETSVGQGRRPEPRPDKAGPSDGAAEPGAARGGGPERAELAERTELEKLWCDQAGTLLSELRGRTGSRTMWLEQRRSIFTQRRLGVRKVVETLSRDDWPSLGAKDAPPSATWRAAQPYGLASEVAGACDELQAWLAWAHRHVFGDGAALSRAAPEATRVTCAAAAAVVLARRREARAREGGPSPVPEAHDSLRQLERARSEVALALGMVARVLQVRLASDLDWVASEEGGAAETEAGREPARLAPAPGPGSGPGLARRRFAEHAARALESFPGSLRRLLESDYHGMLLDLRHGDDGAWESSPGLMPTPFGSAAPGPLSVAAAGDESVGLAEAIGVVAALEHAALAFSRGPGAAVPGTAAELRGAVLRALDGAPVHDADLGELLALAAAASWRIARAARGDLERAASAFPPRVDAPGEPGRARGGLAGDAAASLLAAAEAEARTIAERAPGRARGGGRMRGDEGVDDEEMRRQSYGISWLVSRLCAESGSEEEGEGRRDPLRGATPWEDTMRQAYTGNREAGDAAAGAGAPGAPTGRATAPAAGGDVVLHPEAGELDAPPGTLTVPLMRHQRAALAFLVRRERAGARPRGGVLADDQGLGKTVSIIALLCRDLAADRAARVGPRPGSGGASSEEDGEGTKKYAEHPRQPRAVGPAGFRYLDPPSGPPTSEGVERVARLAEAAGDPVPGLPVPARPNQRTPGHRRGVPRAGTLIVCPNTLLHQWKAEIRAKAAASLRVSVHAYLKPRDGGQDQLRAADVVLVNYSMLVSDWVHRGGPLHGGGDEAKRRAAAARESTRVARARGRRQRGGWRYVERGGGDGDGGPGDVSLEFVADESEDGEELDGGPRDLSDSVARGALFRLRWRRVVLDEAQFAKNFRTKSSAAAAHLRAQSRWVVSGTPVQNELGDLFSYFRFLRYEPLNDLRQFKASLQPPKSVPIGTDDLRVANARTLLGAITLRRVKAAITQRLGEGEERSGAVRMPDGLPPPPASGAREKGGSEGVDGTDSGRDGEPGTEAREGGDDAGAKAREDSDVSGTETRKVPGGATPGPAWLTGDRPPPAPPRSEAPEIRLPPRLVRSLRVRMDRVEREVYSVVVDEAQDALRLAVENQALQKESFAFLSKLTRLRQVACHAALFGGARRRKLEQAAHRARERGEPGPRGWQGRRAPAADDLENFYDEGLSQSPGSSDDEQWFHGPRDPPPTPAFGQGPWMLSGVGPRLPGPPEARPALTILSAAGPDGRGGVDAAVKLEPDPEDVEAKVKPDPEGADVVKLDLSDSEGLEVLEMSWDRDGAASVAVEEPGPSTSGDVLRSSGGPATGIVDGAPGLGGAPAARGASGLGGGAAEGDEPGDADLMREMAALAMRSTANDPTRRSAKVRAILALLEELTIPGWATAASQPGPADDDAGSARESDAPSEPTPEPPASASDAPPEPKSGHAGPSQRPGSLIARGGRLVLTAAPDPAGGARGETGRGRPRRPAGPVKALREKVLIFSQWTRMLDILELALRDEGYSWLRIDGSLGRNERNAVVEEFSSPSGGAQVLLLSLHAASTGLNLTAANHVFFIDPWWNPTVEDQAIDRAHRIGQVRPVKVTRVLVESSIEARILDLQQKKRELVCGIFSDRFSLDAGPGTARTGVGDIRYLLEGA